MQQQDISMAHKEQPGMNIAMNVASKQNGNAGLEREQDGEGEDDRGSRRDKKKKKKKKKRREVESTSTSDGEESDDDADRSKSKKKATAGVTTRINIFTGTQGPPGIGMQSGMTGPNVLSNIAAPMPIMQPMPPMIQQLPSGAKKQSSKRSSKASKSKSSQGEGKQAAAGAPAVIPPAMAGLMSGPDGQDVLVIPMPPGMKLPPFDTAGGGLEQIFGAGFPFTDAQQQQPKKKKKSIDAAAALRRSSSRTSVKRPSQQSIAGTGYAAEGAVAGTGVVVGEEGAAPGTGMQELQRTDVEPPPSAGNQEGQQGQESSMAQSSGTGDANAGRKTMTTEDDTNTMALLIFAAVVGIIVVVVIVFIVATASTSPGTSAAPPATPIPDVPAQTQTLPPGPPEGETPPSRRRRRRMGRRHPLPRSGYISHFRRFNRPVQPYWNIK